MNYNGVNYIAVTLWALDAEGATLRGLDLVASKPILSGYRKPRPAPQPEWEERDGAY